MRESVRSLRAWFLVIGLLWFASCVYFIIAPLTSTPQPKDDISGVISGILGIPLSLGYIYLGIFIKKTLERSPQFIRVFLYVDTGLIVPIQLIRMDFIDLLLTVLVNWYLLANVNRLSNSMQNASGTQ